MKQRRPNDVDLTPNVCGRNVLQYQERNHDQYQERKNHVEEKLFFGSRFPHVKGQRTGVSGQDIEEHYTNNHGILGRMRWTLGRTPLFLLQQITIFLFASDATRRHSCCYD
jgi:hypothetical protein